jgi:AraC-like DNA-binding protein
MEAEYESRLETWSKAKRLIQLSIHSDNCTQLAVARELGMHPKKLQRALRRHQLSFRDLRAEVRLDLAERYLKDSDLPLTIIAEILGFSELSCFSHAFKSRHRVSPLAWRNKVKPTETRHQ